MDLGDEFDLEHFVFTERMCRVCRKTKELTSDFYKTRKGDGPSSYSYECKECMKARSIRNRNKIKPICEEYPDW